MFPEILQSEKGLVVRFNLITVIFAVCLGCSQPSPTSLAEVTALVKETGGLIDVDYIDKFGCLLSIDETVDFRFRITGDAKMLTPKWETLVEIDEDRSYEFDLILHSIDRGDLEWFQANAIRESDRVYELVHGGRAIVRPCENGNIDVYMIIRSLKKYPDFEALLLADRRHDQKRFMLVPGQAMARWVLPFAPVVHRSTK